MLSLFALVAYLVLFVALPAALGSLAYSALELAAHWPAIRRALHSLET